jgi:hypothetical protein
MVPLLIARIRSLISRAALAAERGPELAKLLDAVADQAKTMADELESTFEEQGSGGS